MYIVGIEKTIDPTIFLIQRDCQWDGMTCIVGDGLQIQDQFGRLLGGYPLTLVDSSVNRSVMFLLLYPKMEHGRRLTYEIFGCQQNSAQVMLFNETLDLRGDFGTIKSHHEQLAHGSNQ